MLEWRSIFLLIICIIGFSNAFLSHGWTLLRLPHLGRANALTNGLGGHGHRRTFIVQDIPSKAMYEIDTTRTRYVARVSYDGSRYRGWQDQGPAIKTVQRTLSLSLSQRLGRHPFHSTKPSTCDDSTDDKGSISVLGASRTDQGVHALGQCIHFDIPNALSEKILQPKKVHQSFRNQCYKSEVMKRTNRRFMHALLEQKDIGNKDSNAETEIAREPEWTDGLEHFQLTFNELLPEDIRVYNVSLCPPGNAEQSSVGEPFHATKSASMKKYVYRFCAPAHKNEWNPLIKPLTALFTFSHCFDPTLLEFALQQFIGTHDFKAFANQIEQTRKRREVDTIRTVYSIDFKEETMERIGINSGRYYRVEVLLESALYRMVRNIVGAAMFVASGRMYLEKMVSLLRSGSSRVENPSLSAPPEGLCLEHVYYDHY